METSFHYHGSLNEENREDYEMQLYQYEEMQKQEEYKQYCQEEYLKDNIKEYLKTINLSYYDLNGIEITQADIDFIAKKVMDGSTIEDATNDVLHFIRDFLEEKSF